MLIDVLEEFIVNYFVVVSDLLGYFELEKLVFVGYYWLKGQLIKLVDNVVCLDYFVVKGGKLVVYCW